MVVLVNMLAPIVGAAQVTSTIETQTARSTALAASQVALDNSVALVFMNPALLAEYKGMGLTVGYQKPFSQQFLTQATVGVAFDSGKKFGNFGASTQSLSTMNGAIGLADETALSLHYGAYLMKDRLSSLAVGVTLNYMQISYGQSAGPSGDGTDGADLGSATRMGLDVGLAATLGKNHRIAAVVRNINSPSLGSDGYLIQLPQTLIGGFAYTPVDEVTTTFSLNYASGHPVEFHGGLEYHLSSKVSFMTGMQSQPNRLSAGLKVEFKGLLFEYGVITHPVLPLTHAVSLHFYIEDFE